MSYWYFQTSQWSVFDTLTAIDFSKFTNEQNLCAANCGSVRLLSECTYAYHSVHHHYMYITVVYYFQLF